MKTKLTAEQKKTNLEARREARRVAKRAAMIAAEKAQKPVASLVVSIEWKKSRTWGNLPVASGRIEYADGSWGGTDDARTSGCGYDKESTVIANIFNQCLLGQLWACVLPENKTDKNSVPYGISTYDGRRWFEGGVGTSCYFNIVAFMGGKFDHTASGKTFDVYTATFK